MRALRGLSRRRKQVLITALVLIACAGSAAVLIINQHRSKQAETYRPGEENADITNLLARGLPKDAPTPAFVDVSADAGLADFRVFEGPRTSQLPEDMGSGAAWGDFDNDGDDDLFLVSAGAALGTPPAARPASRLYENLGSGRFQPVAEFPDTRILGMGAAWGDADGDGWLDLVVTGYNEIWLFRNRQGRFEIDDRFPRPAGFWSGASWGDYDRDGDLDLYVCGYVQYREESTVSLRMSQQSGRAVPYTLNPSSYPPERNLLFRNNGHGSFEEVANSLDVDNPDGRSLSALWHDFDGDGWLDLYVANDVSDNVMYRNLSGRFEDVSHPAWVADHRGAMGLTAGDWNRDGDDDLFISHWVAQENALYDSLLADTVTAPGVRPASTAGAAAPPVRFVDKADAVGLGQIALPMVGWGAEFADFDGDGWLDLAVANGSTIESAGAAPRLLIAQAPFLFWNRQGRHFHDLAPLSPPLSKPSVARGLAVADYDDDGDLDVLIVRRDLGPQLLRNDMQRGHWLKLKLRNRIAGTRGVYGQGLGARVIAHVGSAALRRAVSPASYLSQSSSTVHFGLGGADGVDRLEIAWPDGSTTTLGPLAADRTWEITQGEAAPRAVSATAQASSPGPSAGSPPDDRARVRAFWARQREAMRVFKRGDDMPGAARLLREALAYDTSHEDTRYYLASALAATGDVDAALGELETLARANPNSHRALARWGTLRAQAARTPEDLAAAEASLLRARAVNPEETGALLALAEVSILRGDLQRARQRLEAACTTNPRASSGLFLLGYLHWKQGDAGKAAKYLERTRESLGKDWKPRGATAEGDVKRKAYEDATPLARFLQEWTGSREPAVAFAALDRHLRDRSGALSRSAP